MSNINGLDEVHSKSHPVWTEFCFAQHPTASSEEQGFAASFVAQPLILVRPMQRADHSINFGAFPNGCAEELEVVGEDVDLLPDFDAMCCRLYSAEGSLASCIVR
jgi:hypothetical protein